MYDFKFELFNTMDDIKRKIVEGALAYFYYNDELLSDDRYRCALIILRGEYIKRNLSSVSLNLLDRFFKADMGIIVASIGWDQAEKYKEDVEYLIGLIDRYGISGGESSYNCFK